jgi:hypothetical protein
VNPKPLGRDEHRTPSAPDLDAPAGHKRDALAQVGSAVAAVEDQQAKHRWSADANGRKPGSVHPTLR